MEQREGIKHRGFASMSRERHQEIASKGGRASQASGTAHRWTKEEASKAGKKGGSVSRRGTTKAKEGEA